MGAMDFAAFEALSKTRRIVPVYREVVSDGVTPVALYHGLVGEGQGFLLESVEGGDRWGRYSFVGRASADRLTARGSVVTREGVLAELGEGSKGVLEALEAILEAFNEEPLEGLPPLHSGLVGYLGYDVVREVENLPAPDTAGLDIPEAILVFISSVVVLDHWQQRATLISNVVIPQVVTDDWAAGRFAQAQAELDDLERACAAPQALPPIPVPERGLLPDDVRRSVTSEAFQDAVRAAKEYIVEGDIFQVVLAQRFDTPAPKDSFTVYRILRQLNPSPYLYYLNLGDVVVVGSSPEAMVRLRDRQVISRPIAGSRPRGATESEDLRLAGELVEDPKEIAEHVMLVDLARNDLGRVAEFGSEKVEEFMIVERFSHIMHMTSQVAARTRADVSAVDVLRAVIPAGTLSGAPKVRAMQIIDELEVTRRGIYGGVVGYLDFSGNIDTAIAIRTMVVAHGVASVQAGAGVVADSDPQREDEECWHKATAVLAALANAARI